MVQDVENIFMKDRGPCVYYRVSYMLNTITANNLATRRTWASTGLAQFFRNILFIATDGLMNNPAHISHY